MRQRNVKKSMTENVIQEERFGSAKHNGMGLRVRRAQAMNHG